MTIKKRKTQNIRVKSKRLTKKNKTKRLTKKYKPVQIGGALRNIEAFIAKLREIVAFIEQHLGRDDITESMFVAEISRIFKELLHVKSARSDYPTLEEHLYNMKFLLSEFDRKYTDPSNLQRDSLSYKDDEDFNDSACLDAKLARLTGFLLGEDTGITVHNKNAQITKIIFKKFEELTKFLETKPSRHDYEMICNKRAIISSIMAHPLISLAYKKHILHYTEIEDMINSLEKDFFENGFFSYGPVPPAPAPAQAPATAGSGAIIITKIPVAFIKAGSQIFDKDNNLLGKSKFNHYHRQWIAIETLDGRDYMLELIPGMQIISS